ncbi:hypothetical protein NPM17_24520, partial [Escherichia coli]|nr:hypothetical protein [Escherichia coli]
MGGERLEVRLEDASQAEAASRALAPMCGGEDGVRIEDGAVSLQVQRHSGVIVEAVRNLDRAGVGVDDIALLRPTLDDVFLALTGRTAEELEGGADGDDLVRVDALVRLAAAGERLHELGDGGHAGRAADEHDVRDVGHLDAGLADDVFERLAGAVEQILGHLLELRAGERLVEVGRAVLGEREVRQLDARRHLARELLLR